MLVLPPTLEKASGAPVREVQGCSRNQSLVAIRSISWAMCLTLGMVQQLDNFRDVPASVCRIMLNALPPLPPLPLRHLEDSETLRERIHFY